MARATEEMNETAKIIETGEIDPRELLIETGDNGRRYPPERIAEMAVSLLEHGQQAPIRVRTDAESGKKRVSFGFRRSLAGMEIIEQRLRKGFTLRYELVEETAEQARISNYVENLDRKDLNVLDHLVNLVYMRDTLTMKQGEIAKRVNKSASWVSKVFSLEGKFNARAQKAIASGHIPAEQAYELAQMEEAGREKEIGTILAAATTAEETRKKRRKARGPKVMTGKQVRALWEQELQKIEEDQKSTSWAKLCNYMVKGISGEMEPAALIRNAKRLLSE